jgi:hypothetical protein
MTKLNALTIAVGPVLLATFLVAGYTAAELVGMRPLTDRPLNLAEAVADDDPPTVMRRLYAGDSPVAMYHVGADVLGPPARWITPMEAAALANHGPLVTLLIRRGVPVNGHTRAHLLCLAERARAQEVIAALARSDLVPACGPRADELIPAVTSGAAR